MRVLYVDPNVPYISTKHIFLMVLAMVTLLLLPPLLILMVYPTSLYRKISDSISPMWRIRIITYVELFHSSVKDGTNGTRDYRFLSTWFLIVFGFFSQLVPSVGVIVSGDFTTALYMSSAVFGFLAFLCTVLAPYKKGNDLITGKLVILSLMFGMATGIYGNVQRNIFSTNGIIIVLTFPHFVFWCYIFWRVTKKSAVHFCFTESKRCSEERETAPETRGLWVDETSSKRELKRDLIKTGAPLKNS